MKKKNILKRIRWGNVIRLVVGLIFTFFILKDLYLLLFKGGCFTWFGLGTHFMFWGVASFCLGPILKILGAEELVEKLFNIIDYKMEKDEEFFEELF